MNKAKCPDPMCGSENTRFFKYRTLQNGTKKARYICEDCKRSFTLQDESLPSYPQAIIEYRADGSVMVNKLLSMTEEDALNPERVLEIAGFNPEYWKVRMCRVNAWNAMRPEDKGQLVNHQVRLDVEPKRAKDITISDIERFFENYKPKAPTAKTIKYSLSGNALEICLADMHNGRMTADPQARTPEEKLQDTISDILARAKGKKFSVIYFVPLGDNSDADNMHATTTNGTQQFLTKTPYKMLEDTAASLIDVMQRLRKIAPVKYIFVPGNHDVLVSFAVAKIVEAHFKDAKDITFDCSHSPQKWTIFGVNLIAWTHGQMPKSNVFSWLQSKARAEWGQTKYSEIHSGHTHTQTVEERAGQIVRYLPSVADASLWEDGNGYAGNVRSTVSFVWDAARGLQEQWFTNIV